MDLSVYIANVKLTRSEWKDYCKKGFIDGLNYDSHYLFNNIQDAFSFIDTCVSLGFDQYERGDDFIDFVVADLYDFDGNFLDSFGGIYE